MAHSADVIQQVVRDAIREKTPFLKPLYEHRHIEDEAEILRARKLATQIFMMLGKIPEKEIGTDGLLRHDPLLPMSTFFGAFRNEDNELMATTRLLWRDDIRVDELRLPLERIDPVHAEYLRDHEPGSVAEIGSLAKRKGAEPVTMLHLLRGVWEYADAQEVKTFVCGLDPRLYPRFVEMFGDAVVPLSPETTKFPGIKGQQQPLMIDVRRAVEMQGASQHSSGLQRLARRAIGQFITQDAPGVIR